MKPLRVLAVASSWWKSLRAVSLRLHRSTLVLLVPVLAVLVLANVPGWTVACLQPNGDGDGPFYAKVDTRYEHGWPLTYLRRRTLEFLDGRVDFSPWDLAHGIIDFRGLALAGNVVAGIGILILAGVLIEARRRRLQSCFQFRLGELLIFVTLVAIGLSFYAVRRKDYTEQCKIYVWLHRYSTHVSPEALLHWSPEELDALVPQGAAEWTPGDPDWQSEGPYWLLPILGEDRYRELFRRPCATFADEDDLKEAVKLRRLRIFETLGFFRCGHRAPDADSLPRSA